MSKKTFRWNCKTSILIVSGAAFLASLAIYRSKEVANPGPHEAEAYLLVQSLHTAMAKHDWSSIYSNADERYRQGLTADESANMFVRVIQKLGKPVSCKQGKTSIQKSPAGNTIQSECETTFTHNATGHETFFWRESGGTYRLSGYNVSSTALVDR
jgi:hypothetical protein